MEMQTHNTQKQDMAGTDTAPLISILIVSYNTRDMTLECIRSVYEETGDASFEIIAVDNNSGDGSAEAIADKFPHVKLFASKENLGFGRANNLAGEQARGKYLLLLNPDTVIIEQAIDRLVTFAQQEPDAGIWGGRTFFADRSLNPYSCWRRTTPWNVFCRTFGLSGVFSGSSIFNSEAYGGWQRDTIREVDIVAGCFLLISRELWRNLGGFDPAFFMYGEEADLCLRAGELGARPIVTPQAGIIHYGGASETVREEKIIRLLKGKISLVKRHWSPLARPLGTLLYLLWPLRQAVTRRIRASLTPGNQMNRELAETWREVWRRRREWISGYPL